MFRAKIKILLKASILDPQGQAVQNSLHTMNFSEVDSVRIGRYIEITFNSNDVKKAEEKVKNYCEKILVNSVIEQYNFELEQF